MSRTIFLFVLIAIAGVFAFGMSSQTEELRVGIKNAVTYDDFRVSFEEVVEDSRCPEGVDCVWAGRAVIKIAVCRKGESKGTLQLETMGDSQNAIVDGLKIELSSLDPYPKSGASIDQSAYVAVLKVSKAN